MAAMKCDVLFGRALCGFCFLMALAMACVFVATWNPLGLIAAVMFASIGRMTKSDADALENALRDD
jgi:hypothetical protein